MERVKLLYLILGITVAGLAIYGIAARGQSIPPLDMNGIYEVRHDMPPGWRIGPGQTNDYLGGVPFVPNMLPKTYNSWYGTPNDPSTPVSGYNRPSESGTVKINLAKDSSAALRLADDLAIGPYNPVPLSRGSFSGIAIGDSSYRSRGSAPYNFAGLVIARGPAVYSLTLNDKRPNNVDMRVAVERLALALVERVDAAMALRASPQVTEAVSGRSLPGRRVNGKSIVLMDDYAGAAGAAVKLDILGGTAEITKGARSLKVNIGRKEAWLNGKPMTLPFPALRHGGKQVYCPLETLALL